MSFRILPGARADLLAARRWYDEQAPGLGEDLGLAIREALAQRGVQWPISLGEVDAELEHGGSPGIEAGAGAGRGRERGRGAGRGRE